MNIRNHKRGIAAFTLVETLVGGVIMSGMVVSLFAGFTQGFGLIQATRENLSVAQILQGKLETTRLYTWDQITTGYIPAIFSGRFSPSGTAGAGEITYTGTVTVSASANTEAYASELKQVVIQVNWTSGGIRRQRTMTTLVSKYGLQNYIYAAK